MANKEAYFTSTNILSLSRRMIRLAAKLHRMRPLALKAGQAALLLLDLQEVFLSPQGRAYIPSSAAMMPGLLRLAEGFRRAGRPVIATRHINTPADVGEMANWWRERIDPEGWESRLVPQAAALADEVIPKTQYDAFYFSPLQERLEARGVRQVVIGGVMAHLCCETTARAAFVRGFEVIFLMDGTASYQKAYHQATALNLSHGFATLALCADVLAALQGKDG